MEEASDRQEVVPGGAGAVEAVGEVEVEKTVV